MNTAAHGSLPHARRTRPNVLRADFRRRYVRQKGSKPARLLRCLFAPGMQAVIVFRFGHWALRRPKLLRLVLDPIYAVLDFLIHVMWGIELHRRAQIGPGLYIGHSGGIIVSPLAIIGSNCNLSQSVTIGVSGEGEKFGAPVIGNNVYIAPGARLFGKITIGDNVKIGANAVVHQSIPDNAVVVLDPGFKIISYKGNRDPAEAHSAEVHSV
jgi:serine O-acetyltransferase